MCVCVCVCVADESSPMQLQSKLLSTGVRDNIDVCNKQEKGALMQS